MPCKQIVLQGIYFNFALLFRYLFSLFVIGKEKRVTKSNNE